MMQANVAERTAVGRVLKGAVTPLRRGVERLVGGRGTNGAGVLLVTSRHRLWQRYGPDGLQAIERELDGLIDAMDARGLRGTLLYADDSSLLGELGLLPAETGDAASVARVVRGTCAQLGRAGRRVEHVLLLGDDGVVPFHRQPNPSPDDDEQVLSDHIYALTSDDPLRPVRGVGRLPDPGLEALLGAIADATAAHRRLAAGDRLPLSPTAFGFSASVWKRAARGVYGRIGVPNGLRLSPPLGPKQLPAMSGESRFRYFNLHGLEDAAEWFGQRDPSFAADYPMFPVALRPEDLTPAPGSVVFSAACFGAHLTGRATHDSMALTSLAGGALAFVGATGVAYGGLDGPLVAADALAFHFWDALLAGRAAGAALAEAKWRLVGAALEQQGYLDAEDEKAVLNFVLYGDPSLVHHAPSVWAEDAAVASQARDPVEWAGPTEQVGTLSVRPYSHSKSGVDLTCDVRAQDGLVEYVRKAVADRLPEFGTSDVRVEASTAARAVYAKTTGGAGAERAAPPGDTTVVTLTKSLPTCFGPCCRETVRVTVDGRGRIRRVAISH